jgi:hypothetical protein
MSGRGWLKLPPLALALTLTACATTGTGAIDAEALKRVCAAWPAVSWSAQDTAATITDARANNAARAAFCAGVE